MRRSVVLALLKMFKEGCDHDAPLIPKLVSTRFWAIWDIHLIFVLSGHQSDDFELFGTPKIWRMSNMSNLRVPSWG